MKIRKKVKEHGFMILAFIFPIAIMMILFYKVGVGINQKLTFTTSDMFAQYIGFFAKLKDVFNGEGSIFYAFNKTIGGSTIGLFAYYLGSPLNLLLILFPKRLLSEVIFIIYLIKIGLCGVSLYIYISKVYKKNDLSTLIFSLCYSLMAYNIVFYMNIMWLDGVLLLPLIALGIENIINKDKYILYIGTLFLAIISNYYIAYMICIFSIFYFIYKVILYNRLNLEKIIKYVISSLLAGGLSGFILIPVVYSLKTGKATFNLFAENIHFTEDIFSTLSKFIIGSYNSNMILSGPANIFCGVLTLLLVLMYFCNKDIKLKEKLFSLAFLIVMILSFTISTIVLVWHGFNYPIGFEYRNSFLFSFLIIILGYEAWVKRDGIIIKHIIISLGIIFAFSIVMLLKKYPYLSYKKIIITFIFAAIYCFIFIAYKKGKIKSKVVSLLSLFLVVSELSINGYLVLIYYTYAPNEYVDGYIEIMEPIVEELNNKLDNFYRIEKNFNNTYNDSMLLNYNGLNHSSSVNERNTKNILSSLGYKTASTYEGFNNGSTIPIDSLMGIKYLISINDRRQFPAYKYLENDCYSNIKSVNGFTIYENPYALPIAFMVSNNLRIIAKDSYSDLFNYNQEIYNSMINNDYELYNPLKISDIKLNNVRVSEVDGENLYEKINLDLDGTIEFEIKAEDNNPVYMFLKSDVYEESMKDDIRQVIKGNSVEVDSSGGAQYYQFTGQGYNIEFIGNYEKSEDINVRIKLIKNQTSIKEIQAYSCNMDNFKNIYNELSTNTIEGTEYRDGYLKGDITATAEKTLMFTSIPYDKGWTVRVDDEEYNYSKILNGFIGIELPEGKHTIEFKYKAPGLKIGVIISVISFGILCFLKIYRMKKSKNYL